MLEPWCKKMVWELLVGCKKMVVRRCDCDWQQLDNNWQLAEQWDLICFSSTLSDPWLHNSTSQSSSQTETTQLCLWTELYKHYLDCHHLLYGRVGRTGFNKLWRTNRTLKLMGFKKILFILAKIYQILGTM